MESNPYSSPSANLFGSTSTSSEAVSQVSITHLQKTKPWVRLVAAVFFFFGILMILGGAGFGVLGGAAMSQQNPELGAAGGIIAGVGGLLYAVMGLLYLFPAIKLWKYGTKIGDLSGSRAVADLEAALNQQRSFWKFVGILTLVSLCLVVVAVIIGAVGGIAAAASAASAGS